MTKEPGGSIARVEPSHAKTQYDALPWPDGCPLGDVPPDVFTSRLVALKIPGASHEFGREANAAAYARHLERLRTEAAAAAVNAWLAEAAR
ncbi:hypothetical protein I6F36_05770 [Bradyrhizobium sp. BRP19]|uniref:hypothetical protein n=1 Tax=Bradyrhizobium sp. BRP19 TaxID=2793823 RepID=UPI001CD7405A|nr:hypothetical protein [Bradyrhizobium sp. BRP19]MCA1546311.1 hypothetical protein [Bradyrhizobium sp. BRP19]